MKMKIPNAYQKNIKKRRRIGQKQKNQIAEAAMAKTWLRRAEETECGMWKTNLDIKSC